MPGNHRPFVLATDGRNPWDQQPGESNAMYQRFCFYRDWAVIPRRLLDVAQELSKQDPRRVSTASLMTYAGRFLWEDRAAPYDDHRRAERAAQQDDQVLSTAERIQKEHLETATALRKRVTEEILARPFDEASLRDLRELLKLAIDTEWKTLGLDRQQLQVTGPDGGALVVSLDGLAPDARAASLAETTTELQRRLDRLGRGQDDDAD